MSRTLSRKSRKSKAAARKKNSNAIQRWTSRIRVENRNGLTSYAVEFSNGHATATLRGSFSRLPVSRTTLQREAFAAAANWLAHVRPDKKAPAPPIGKLHYIRNKNQTNPNNRHRREHAIGRRAA